MRCFLVGVILLASLLTPAAAQVKASNQNAPSHNAPTQSFPRLKPFELHTVNGAETVTLQKILAKVVVFDFFFPTCEECVLEMPRLCALDKKYHSDKFALYLVNIVPEQDARVPAMLHKAGCTLPVLHTDTMPWAIHWIGKKNWGPYGAPETLLVDADGRIASHLQFNTAKHRVLADEKIAALLKSGGVAERSSKGR